MRTQRSCTTSCASVRLRVPEKATRQRSAPQFSTDCLRSISVSACSREVTAELQPTRRLIFPESLLVPHHCADVPVPELLESFAQSGMWASNG
jgi:hypothetical protein